MLEKIYAALGYEDIFDIKADDVREFAIGQAHNKLMKILSMCQDLLIIEGKVNEDTLDDIESEE